MAKQVRYEFDELNRLVIVDPQDALQPRRVVEGEILINGENRLVYPTRTKPQPGGEPSKEQDYAFDGTWRRARRDEHRCRPSPA